MNRFVAIACLAIGSWAFAPQPTVSAAADRSASLTTRVSVTDAACDPDQPTVPAGSVTFSIHNSTSRVLEWEILDGIMVVDERENIPSGATKTLAVKLSPGDYQVTCGLLSNPKGRLRVVGRDGAPAKIAQTDLIGPLAEYRVYVSGEIDAMVEDTRRLAGVLKSGVIKAAQELYAAAHAHYARLAPVALFFPDLDGIADPKIAGQAGPDPTLMGFRQLAWELSAGGPHNFVPLADKLVVDVLALQSRFDHLPLTPAPTFAGALQTISGSAAGELGQAPDRLSGVELSDLKGYVEGTQKIVDLFQPLIEKTDKRLSLALAGGFATFASVLAKYQSPTGPFESTVTMSPEDLSLLQNVAKQLTADLGLIPSVLGVG